jgi:hypothetical protein
MELDLQSLLVHSCTHWLRPRNTLPPPHICAHIRGRYCSAKIDDISLWPPWSAAFIRLTESQHGGLLLVNGNYRFQSTWRLIKTLVGFGRACAHPSFEFIATPNRALRALPTHQIKLRCSPKNKKIDYFHKQNASLLAWTRGPPGRIFFHSATLHLTDLHCILLS